MEAFTPTRCKQSNSPNRAQPWFYCGVLTDAGVDLVLGQRRAIVVSELLDVTLQSRVVELHVVRQEERVGHHPRHLRHELRRRAVELQHPVPLS